MSVLKSNQAKEVADQFWQRASAAFGKIKSRTPNKNEANYLPFKSGLGKMQQAINHRDKDQYAQILRELGVGN